MMLFRETGEDVNDERQPLESITDKLAAASEQQTGEDVHDERATAGKHYKQTSSRLNDELAIVGKHYKRNSSRFRTTYVKHEERVADDDAYCTKCADASAKCFSCPGLPIV